MNAQSHLEQPSHLGSVLTERQLGVSQGWLIRLRWIAGAGVLFATWIAGGVLKFGLRVGPLTAIGIAILAYNTLFHWRWRQLYATPNRPITRTCHMERVQILADWIAMTLLIHFTGGIESPVIPFFFLHLALASILILARVAYILAAVASILMSALALLEYFEVLPHVAISGYLSAPEYQNPAYVAGTLFFFVSAVFAITFLTTRTTARLRQREAEVVQLSSEMQRSYGQLQTLYASAQAVSSTLDLQEVLDRLTREVTQAMQVKACALRLLDKTGARLEAISVYGLSQEYQEKGELLVDQSPLDRTVLSGKTVIIDDVRSDNRLQYHQAVLAEGIRAILTAPVPGRAGPLGLIRVYCDRVHRFTADDAAFLSAIAAQGGIAIENAIAYRTLQSLDEAKRKFVLMVTHELRSPVGVVRSLLRTLTGGYAGPLPELQQDMLNRALRRADALQALIDDLLDLATHKTGLRVATHTEVVDLQSMLKKVAERYAPLAAEKGHTFDLRLEAPGALLIQVAAEEIDRAIANLVSNAIKYTPAGGRVTLRLAQQEGQAWLEVSDSGIGIPKDALPHMFEEFYRAPNAKAQVKEGTGLGLVVTKDIITAHGGRIQVRSVEHEGTTFTVTFPLAPPIT